MEVVRQVHEKRRDLKTRTLRTYLYLLVRTRAHSYLLVHKILINPKPLPLVLKPWKD